MGESHVGGLPIISIIIYGRGRGVPRWGKAFPLRGKVARYAPDEGEPPGKHPLISHLR